MELSQEQIKRFWAKVNKNNPDGCWPWLACDRKGYGAFDVRGKLIGAHKIAYMLSFGDIPSGLWVLHKCDNPICVRPDHLFLGTNIDNVKDREAKGRGAKGEYLAHRQRHHTGAAHWSNHHPERVARGERNGTAIFTEEEIQKIRKEYVPGQITQVDLAKKYGIGQGHLNNILKRRLWKHVA